MVKLNSLIFTPFWKSIFFCKQLYYKYQTTTCRIKNTLLPRTYHLCASAAQRFLWMSHSCYTSAIKNGMFNSFFIVLLKLWLFKTDTLSISCALTLWGDMGSEHLCFPYLFIPVLDPFLNGSQLYILLQTTMYSQTSLI